MGAVAPLRKVFWTKVRSRWLPAASAATVLARQYAGDLSKDMRGAPGRLLSDAWNAPGRLLQRVRAHHVYALPDSHCMTVLAPYLACHEAPG